MVVKALADAETVDASPSCTAACGMIHKRYAAHSCGTPGGHTLAALMRVFGEGVGTVEKVLAEEGVPEELGEGEAVKERTIAVSCLPGASGLGALEPLVEVMEEGDVVRVAPPNCAHGLQISHIACGEGVEAKLAPAADEDIADSEATGDSVEDSLF